MNKKAFLAIGAIGALVCASSTEVSADTVEGIVTAVSLNVRSGPSTQHNVLYKISKNTKILILESKNGWHKIKYNGKEGWASSTYIKVQNTSSNQQGSTSTTTVQKETTTNVNLRKGPSTSYSKVTTLNKGVKVKYISKNGDWDKVEYNGISGYIMSKYLKNIYTNTDTNSGAVKTESYKVNTSSLNVRDKESTSGRVLGKLRKETIVNVYSISNGWAKISYNNKTAYVSSKYLTKTSSSTSNNTSSQTKPSEQKNYLNIKYKELDNKETIELVSTSKELYTHFFLSNPNRLVIDISNTQLTSNILDNLLNKKFIKTYRASYDANKNTTRVVVEFNDNFNQSKVELKQNDKTINIIYNEPIVPEEPKNYINIQYKESDKKETIELTSTSKVSYTHFFLSNPNRLVIDMKKTQLKSNISDQNIDKQFIKKYRANYDTSKNTTRVVVEFGENFDKSKVEIGQTNNLINILYNETIKDEVSIIKPPTSYPNVTLRNINKSFDDYIKSQEGRLAIISKDGKFIKASIDEVREYANPYRDTLDNRDYKFQFLSLDKFRNVNISGLNSYIAQLKPLNGNTNIFLNKGEAFVNSSKKYNIDPLYFISHTLLETGNGGSVLAQGNEVELNELGVAKRYHYKDSEDRLCYYVGGAITPDDGSLTDAQKESPVMFVKLKDKETSADTKTVTVYNLFGIGAVDGVPVEAGTTKAYDLGWTSVEKAIDGGASWISSNYINSTKYTHQNTLYFMKWDYVYGWHQYSTDVDWTTKISKNINKLSSLYSGGDNDLNFIFPEYK